MLANLLGLGIEKVWLREKESEVSVKYDFSMVCVIHGEGCNVMMMVIDIRGIYPFISNFQSYNLYTYNCRLVQCYSR